jgi:hypothetical protein
MGGGVAWGREIGKISYFKNVAWLKKSLIERSVCVRVFEIKSEVKTCAQ